MAEQTGISWTDHTFNTHWGCTKVKLENGKLDRCCAGCYAERDSHRYGFDLWGPEARRRFFGDTHWAEPLKWQKKAVEAGARRRVFCASMSDILEQLPAGHPDEQAMDDARARLWALIPQTPDLDWLLLTKRIENVAAMMPPAWVAGDWPDNVWLGTSIGGPDAMYRLTELLRWAAIVRFVSYEPAYGPLPLTDEHLAPCFAEDDPRFWRADGRGVDWLISGGESGAKAAPSHPNWFREARDRCTERGVAYHHKQNGEYAPVASGRRDDEPPASTHMMSADGTVLTRQRWDEEAPLGLFTPMSRVGRKAAGRLLDGRIWDEFPAPDRARFREAMPVRTGEHYQRLDLPREVGQARLTL